MLTLFEQLLDDTELPKMVSILNAKLDEERRTKIFVEQYLLKGTEYELRLKSGSGEIESAVVSGFRIPIRAIFAGEENLRVLRQILTPA